jgi:hypothetical protein
VCVLEILKAAAIIIQITDQHFAVLPNKVLDSAVPILIVGKHIIGVGRQDKGIEASGALHHALTDILLVKPLSLRIGKVNKLVCHLTKLDIQFLVT